MNFYPQKQHTNHFDEYYLPFEAWDLRLYLNSHPNDERALSAYKQICAASHDNVNYACVGIEKNDDKSCGCSEINSRNNPKASRWSWIDNPWPWEYEANSSGGCR